MRVAVIDGQGGGIGKAIVEKLRAAFGDEIEILALGTNALATPLMLKSGANEGASGENTIIVNAPKVNLIVGSIGIVVANSMLGELSPAMAKAIAESSAKKVLIPLNKCNIHVAGIKNEPLPHYIEDAIEIIRSFIGGSKNV
jgi:NAD(P)-dependent dehydrogenase (short-subunit alcohol dehydrogenase family)